MLTGYKRIRMSGSEFTKFRTRNPLFMFGKNTWIKKYQNGTLYSMITKFHALSVKCFLVLS